MSATMSRQPQQTSGMQPMLTPQMASAASNLAAMGSGRDNMLAHINPREAQILMQLGGKGNANPRTGLPQFDDGGGGGYDPPPPPLPTLNTGNAGPAGFVPSDTAYQTIGGQSADTPFDTALLSSYDVGSLPSGVAPIDPALANFVSTNTQSFATGAGGGAQDPFEMAGQPNADPLYSQFLATPGNPNFSINAQGYADFTPQGQAAYGAYADQAQQSIAANAKKNESGIGAFLGTPEGGLSILGLPLGIGALAEAAGAIGVGASLGGFAGDAGAAGADAFDLGAAGTSIVPDAALGTAADPFAVGSAVTSDFAGGLGDSFVGAEGIGAAGDVAGSAAADLGIGAAGAAVPDATFGVVSPASSDLFLGGTTAESADTSALAAGDTFVDGSAPAATGGGFADTGGGAGIAGDAGPSTSLATADTAQFPSGFIEPPDPATGLSPGAAAGSSGGGVGGWLSGLGDKLTAGLSDPFKLLGLAASGYGLLNSSSKNKQLGDVGANETQLQNLANQTGAQGAALSGYLTSGTLPAGLQAQVDQSTQSAIAQIKSRYAGNGIPPGSTMEQQDINGIMQQKAIVVAQIGQQLLQSGTALTTLDANTLTTLLKANTGFADQTNQAIANLARALSGGGLTKTTTTTTA